MTVVANEIELEPLIQPPGGRPLWSGSDAPAFLGAVKVRVSVRVGGAHTSVGELLVMNQGTVLPLDRLVDEPLDVLVDEHVIARGTLVAVGDYFGVRITEMAIPGSTQHR
jgi:flagellar motor switch protein FliN/FliY